jgi:pyruvate dehydrogenase E1 component
MSAVSPGPASSSSIDVDSQETREWMDALSAVIQSEGPQRAHFLLEQLLEHARQRLCQHH